MEVKSKKETKQRGFVMFKRTILKAKGLSMQAKLVYALLLDYAWQKQECFPGQQRLAEDLGVHRNTILKYLKELQGYGLIASKRRGLNATNIYYILTPQEVSGAHQPITTEAQASMHHETQSVVNKVEEEKYKKDKYKQTLTLEDKEDLRTFDEEAIELATSLRDLKNIKFYQKVVNQKNRKFINEEDYSFAVQYVRSLLRADEIDKRKSINSPGAFFTKTLKNRIKAREEKTKHKLQRQKIKEMRAYLVNKMSV